MAEWGRRIGWRELARAGAWVVVFSGCAVPPPTLPNSTLGGVTDTDQGTEEGTIGTDMTDDTGDGSSGGVGSSLSTGESTGAGSAATEDGSTSTGQAESTGTEAEWYAGHYEGVYDGGCPEPIPISGNGTWAVDIDNDGNIVGTYDGDFDGNIVGTVDPRGVTTATATGPDLGECNWDGIIEADGSAAGTLDCSFGCSGQWSGSK